MFRPFHDCILWTTLIPDPKRGRVLRPCFSPIIEAGGGDISMAHPFLHPWLYQLQREGIGSGRGPYRMHAQSGNFDIQTGCLSVLSHHISIK